MSIVTRAVIDYDDDDYDYREHWQGREYEQWAEHRILSRLVPRLGRPGWFADLGGGYGRNAAHYLPRAGHVVLVDYSGRNLTTAAVRHAAAIAAGRLHLVRGDLNALPFVDGAFDAAMVVRVLHHLTDLDRALPEMARTIRGRWLLDVPIKHHALGRLRSLLRGRYEQMRSTEPLVVGASGDPFHTFHLDTVRRQLADAGWSATVAGSVNNFRRWDQVLPGPVVRALRPAVQALELLAQRAGRGWWGPNQFLLATSSATSSATPSAPPPPPAGNGFQARMWCPRCHGSLAWDAGSARCVACGDIFARRGPYWDFAT